MPMDLHRQPPLPPMIRSGLGSGCFLVRPHQLRRPCVTQPVDELCRVIILAGTVSHFQPHISPLPTNPPMPPICSTVMH